VCVYVSVSASVGERKERNGARREKGMEIDFVCPLFVFSSNFLPPVRVDVFFVS